MFSFFGTETKSELVVLPCLLASSMIGTLAVAPVLLATDVETWQEGVEAPSMNPMEYFNVTMENWTRPDIEVKRHQLHWLQMPQPIWPSSDDLANTSSRRTSFWLSYMSFKFAVGCGDGFFGAEVPLCKQQAKQRWSTQPEHDGSGAIDRAGRSTEREF